MKALRFAGAWMLGAIATLLPLCVPASGVAAVPPARIAVLQPDLRTDGTGTVPVQVPGPGSLSALETAWPSGRPEPRVGHQTVLSRDS